jgi:hypothetical protein
MCWFQRRVFLNILSARIFFVLCYNFHLEKNTPLHSKKLEFHLNSFSDDWFVSSLLKMFVISREEFETWNEFRHKQTDRRTMNDRRGSLSAQMNLHTREDSGSHSYSIHYNNLKMTVMQFIRALSYGGCPIVKSMSVRAVCACVSPSRLKFSEVFSTSFHIGTWNFP